MSYRTKMRNVAMALATSLTIITIGVAGTPVSPRKGVIRGSPSISVAGGEWSSYWGEAFTAVYSRLLKNLHMPNGFFEHRWAKPSPIFTGAYLWDTAFISQVWKPWDVATAQEVNLTVMDFADNGRLQHFVGRFTGSSYTQPPVMTWSVWENYLWSNDRAYLEMVYPILVDYNRWLYENRRFDNGLFFWLHSYESGIDNSPRFGSRDESVMVDMKNLAAVDLCSYMARQNETLSLMARELGNDIDAKKYEMRALHVRTAMEAYMWDKETGLYYDYDMTKKEKVKVNTIASLLPLFGGVPGGKNAKRLRNHVMAPEEYNTPIPLPTVAMNDPSFEKDMWRGPVWVNTAYMVIVGLERYGYIDEAADLAFRLVDGVYKSYAKTGKIVEFYDPERTDYKELNRKKGNLYKRITLGNKPRPKFVGWTGLVNTLLIEHLIGFRKNRGKRSLSPNFPPAAAGASFITEIPAESLRIEMSVGPDGRTGGIVFVNEGQIGFDLEKGESLSWP